VNKFDILRQQLVETEFKDGVGMAAADLHNAQRTRGGVRQQMRALLKMFHQLHHLLRGAVFINVTHYRSSPYSSAPTSGSTSNIFCSASRVSRASASLITLMANPRAPAPTGRDAAALLVNGAHQRQVDVALNAADFHLRQTPSMAQICPGMPMHIVASPAR
jgi:hypothetical protein